MYNHDKQTNKNTKLHKHWEHKGLEKHHCKIRYNKKTKKQNKTKQKVETNLSNAIQNSNNNNSNDIDNNASYNNSKTKKYETYRHKQQKLLMKYVTSLYLTMWFGTQLVQWHGELFMNI